MVKSSMKYNPAFLSEDELVDSFVVRHKDLELIMQTIQENVTDSNQHVLITGPRGIGKTMLLLRATAEIHQSETLSKAWYPLKFAEESYEVSTPGEFWLNAIRHLSVQTGDKSWEKTWQELNDVIDENILRERALAKLMDYADGQNKRILIIVENLNMLLSDQMNQDDAWKIRHTLQNEPRIMVLASAVKGFDDIEGIDKALFDSFIRHELLPLDEKQCEKVWVATTGKKMTDNRARPIQIITGGSPRLVKIISSFGADLSLKELMDYLTHLVDDHTDYFKSQIEVLPPKERKVFVSLAELWDASPSKDVAKLARLPVNKTSALLNRLLGRGVISLAKSQGRVKFYQLTERLFNIYYLMRSRGVKSHRITMVVNFLIEYYGIEKITDKVRRIAEEACCLESHQREDHCLVVEGILRNPSVKPVWDRIIDETPREFFNTPQFSEPIKKIVFTKEYIKIEEEIVAYDSLKEKGKDAQLKTVTKELRQAVQTSPDDYLSWFKLGSFLMRFGKCFDEAEIAFHKAVELQPESFIPWTGLSELFHEHLGRYEEAEIAYRKTIELGLESSWAWVWSHLGKLLHENLKRYGDAESAYRKAIELNPDYIFAWGQLGELFHERLERFEDAEEAYRKAVELNPKYHWAWAKLGQLLHKKLKRFEDAEKAYQKALDNSPENAGIWLLLAFLLHDELERYDEAEKAYLKAIEVFPSFPILYSRLFLLLLKNRETPEDALQMANKALMKSSDDPKLYNYLAWAIYEDKADELLPQAEKWIKIALDAMPENESYLHTYTCILLEQGKIDEALKAVGRYLEYEDFDKEDLADSILLFIRFAVHGAVEEAIKIMQASSNVDKLEPLIVGLQLYAGIEVNTAVEIREIGMDIMKRIQAEKENMTS